METLAHLEVQIKFTDDLGSVWAVNCHSIDWECVPFEGPFRSSIGRDHDGRREVPRNGLSHIVMIELAARSRSLCGRPTLAMLGSLDDRRHKTRRSREIQTGTQARVQRVGKLGEGRNVGKRDTAGRAAGVWVGNRRIAACLRSFTTKWQTLIYNFAVSNPSTMRCGCDPPFSRTRSSRNCLNWLQHQRCSSNQLVKLSSSTELVKSGSHSRLLDEALS